MSKHFWSGTEDFLQVDRVATEIGHQNFDAGAGGLFMYLANSFGVKPGAFVGKIVSGNSCDRCISKLHLLY
jgi:hypothetical protein